MKGDEAAEVLAKIEEGYIKMIYINNWSKTSQESLNKSMPNGIKSTCNMQNITTKSMGTRMKNLWHLISIVEWVFNPSMRMLTCKLRF